MVRPPCMDCKSRTVGCHGKCGQYKEYVAKLQTIKAGRDDKIIINEYSYDLHSRMQRGKMRKRKKYR